MTTILLYPQLEANRLVMIREMLKPMEREMKRPPAAQWEIERLSSINGRMGEKIVREEKLRNQRPQKIKGGEVSSTSPVSNQDDLLVAYPPFLFSSSTHFH
jgi:hypothetical protein